MKATRLQINSNKPSNAKAMEAKKEEETLMGPKHKAAERWAIFDPVTEELITDKNEILATTLKYNIYRGTYKK